MSFADDSVTLTEDSTTYVVQIKLNKPSTVYQQLNIHIDGDASYGVDFLTSPASENGIIPISLSTGDSTASFTVQLLNDSIDELRETIVMTIQSSTGLQAGDQSIFTFLLEDNDIPAISFEKRFDIAAESDEPTIVTMKLSTPIASEQTVTLTLYARHNVVYGTDYTTEPTPTGDSLSLTIPAGSSEVQFTITPKSDKKHERPWEMVSFYLTETSEGLTAISPRLFVFTIIDVKRKLHFTASPNPTDDIIRLECEALDEAEIIHVDLRNHLGGIVFKGSGTLGEINRELGDRMNNSRKGIYVLKVTAEDQSYSLRILKR